jgi:hypothetical protein
MAFFNKLKWILGILMVFVLIIATNLIDRNNFLRVKDSVITIYEDRLVAKDLIFDIYTSVQEKELAVATSDSVFFLERNDQVNNHIQGLVSRFEKTKLTVEEGHILQDLKTNLETLSKSETTFVKSKFAQKSTLNSQISNVKENLYDLSEIQLNEGKKQMSISKKAIDSVELFTQLEIYVLIFLAIIIQIIVIYKPKED